MINYAYSQRNQYNSTPIITLLCFIVFFDLTAFFFLTFMNICFENIVSNPPIWILVILYLIMGLDMLAGIYYSKKITIKFWIDLVILVFLILSWATQVQALLYLSALVFLRFPQIVRFNDTMKDKVRSNGNLFAIYTLLKIIYLFTTIGHVFGCIFYAIDNALIQAQYYGTIQQNPSLYYQGELLCYSPIYSLSQINRYLYAMYYIFSLLATVAYGDIIPKNPVENAYVCFLLVFSTISIGYVIEQLLIVLRNSWDTITQIIRKMKFLDSMLSKSATVKNSSRLTLVNFMVYSLRHQAFNRPKFQRLTTNLHYRLRGQSICMKKKDVDPSTPEGLNKIINMKTYEQFSVPRFLAIYLLPMLQQVYYPGNYEIVNNQNVKDTNSLFIILSGSLKVGYGQKYQFKSIVSQRGKILCWKQFIWGNKNLNKSFKVQTRQLSQFYTITTDTLRNIIKEEKMKSLSDDNFSQMLESYHIERNIQLTKLYENELQQVDLQRIINKKNAPQVKLNQLQSQILGCWGCDENNHMPANCPIFHYRPNLQTILKSKSRIIKWRRRIPRKELRSEKIKKNNGDIRNRDERKYALKQFLKRKDEQLQNLKALYYRQMPIIFERYYSYQNFYPQFNFKTNNFGTS